MKKTIILSILFLLSYSIKANNFNEIRISKNYKKINTFSGDLSNKKSFHLIFVKNIKTKNYEVLTFTFDGEKTESLPRLVNDKPYRIVSFHQKNDMLTLLLSYKKKKNVFLTKVDYNLSTKQKFVSKPIAHDNFLTSIRTKEKSILIEKTNDALKIAAFVGDDKFTTKELRFDKKSKLYKFFKNESVTSIKTDEFVANGSTNKVRLYYENNTLFFTRDTDEPLNINVVGISLNNKRTNITQVLKLNLDETKLVPKFFSFKNANGVKFKKATSFLSNNKLFQLALSKKTGHVNIADLNTGNSLNTFALDQSLSKYIKGNNQFQGIDKFLRNAGKNKHNVTITANKTNSNKIRLRIDYVDITYSYSYNWWFQHWHMQQHQMFIQQNIQRSIPTGFGPKQPNEYAFEMATVLKEKRFFELLIDNKGKLLNEDLPETIYRDIDKQKYIKELDKNKSYKFVSSCFLKDSFRSIVYNRKKKSFIIQTRNL